MTFIQFDHVEKSFGPKVVYRDLSIDIEEGSAVTIIGGSGSGKSVMLKMLIGLLRPDSGGIRVADFDLGGRDERAFVEVRRKIGMLFQSAALFDSMSVFDNIAYGLRERGERDEKKIGERVHECLTDVGLDNVDNLLPSSLSGGMRKRVGLARALATRPQIMLYDEPTTGLDPINTSRINQLIVRARKQYNMTSIVVTHDMASAFQVSDRIVMVEGGVVVYDATTEATRVSADPRIRAFVDGVLE